MLVVCMQLILNDTRLGRIPICHSVKLTLARGRWHCLTVLGIPPPCIQIDFLCALVSFSIKESKYSLGIPFYTIYNIAPNSVIASSDWDVLSIISGYISFIRVLRQVR